MGFLKPGRGSAGGLPWHAPRSRPSSLRPPWIPEDKNNRTLRGSTCGSIDACAGSQRGLRVQLPPPSPPPGTWAQLRALHGSLARRKGRWGAQPPEDLRFLRGKEGGWWARSHGAVCSRSGLGRGERGSQRTRTGVLTVRVTWGSTLHSYSPDNGGSPSILCPLPHPSPSPGCKG